MKRSPPSLSNCCTQDVNKGSFCDLDLRKLAQSGKIFSRNAFIGQHQVAILNATEAICSFGSVLAAVHCQHLALSRLQKLILRIRVVNHDAAREGDSGCAKNYGIRTN